MEADEIGVVLQRASELHTKISDAIERALKSEFLLTTNSAAQDLTNQDDHPNAGGLEDPGEINAEAKSLGAIRDALEALEEQLECLQTLQHQQRVDRDTALAELEESRRILLNRLRNHHGKEWEVVHEALAFAGEPVENRDELPLPPYTKPLTSFTQSSGDIPGEDSPPRITASGSDPNQREEANLFGIRLNFFSFRKLASRLLGPGIGATSRAVMVVAGVLTVILLSEVRHQKCRNVSRSKVMKAATKKAQPSPPVKTPPVYEEKCPPGKVMVLQDGVPTCVVKERIEIPFHGEVSSPDVLFGRG